MALHPQCQAIVDAANTAGAPFEADDYRAIRKLYRIGTAAYTHATPPLDSVANLMIAGAAGNLPVRLYRPREAPAAAPALVYFHGGGWVVGDLETHDHLCRYIAGTSGCVVIAVDYRLAPEHRFPAAFDDACAAVRWVSANAGNIGVDPKRLAVGGDSAGGNLAAAVALAMRDEGGIMLRLQVLLYPAVDFTADNDSLRTNASGYLLSAKAMDQFCDWYLDSRLQRTDPRASPQLAADHSGLPRTLVIAAEYDPLRDEAVAYAQTLQDAGVAVTCEVYPGMVHGFARMGGRVDDAVKALDQVCDALSDAFA